MTSSPAEGALVGQAQAGSTRAFSQLVELHSQAVRAFLRRLTGNWAEADDLAQEVFVAAWQGLARFDRTRDLRPWLCGLAYRKYLSARRSFFRAARRETQFAAEQETVTKPMSDARLDLMKAMNTLPAEQRAAVALCLAAEFSHAEAAETLGIPLGTVKSHVSRGRAKLLEALGGESAPRDAHE
jgi:RNA polymerase sigma factor (sigma-70 family)